MNLRTIASPLGDLLLTATDSAIVGLDVAPTGEAHHSRSPLLDAAATQLAEYFAGDRATFDLPLAPHGTPFQTTVWDTLQRIPYGETVSYADIARSIGRPKAVRAVGGANGRNPIAILIPCHRVIASDGSLGGYTGGLDIKRHLLTLERSPSPPAEDLSTTTRAGMF